MAIPILSSIGVIAELALRIWDAVSPVSKLKRKRRQLERESERYQIEGDVLQLRRVRGEIEDIDSRIKSGDY